jgi:ubiquinone/menaquinone biosynthesis C-methylase UbiE
MKNMAPSPNSRARLNQAIGESRSGRPSPLRLTRPPRPRVLETSPIHETEEAVEYDAMVRRNFGLLNRPFVEMLLKIGPERARVLDIGTGPGRIPVELARARPGWEIWGVDMSEDMLSRARGHAKEAGVDGQVRFLRGTAGELPFANGDFDLTVSHFMLHHLERPEALFNEAARVTRGGGRVIIKDLLRQPRWKAGLLFFVSKYVLGHTACQMKMYEESMDAALTIAEVRAALKSSKLNMAQVKSFRSLDFVVTA